MKDITRVLAIVVWVATLLVPAEMMLVLKDDLWTLVLGTVALLVLVLWDAPTGFFLGLAVLTGLYRTHINRLNVFGWISSVQDHGHTIRTKSLFTTSDHLERAQTNVVNKNDFTQEIIGIKGVYGEPVYGAQGITKDVNALPGYGMDTPVENYQ
jgi:hypothetical protein